MLNLDYLFNIGDRSQCSPVVTILDSDGNELIGKSGWEFYTVDQSVQGSEKLIISADRQNSSYNKANPPADEATSYRDLIIKYTSDSASVQAEFNTWEGLNCGVDKISMNIDT